MDDVNALRSIVESAPTCTLITQGRNGNFRARTMTRLNALEQGCLDFATDLASNKVGEICVDRRVTLFFVDPRTRDTASLYGTGEIIEDLQERKCSWKEFLRHHWPQGHTDPAFVVLRVTLTHGEYLLAAPEVYGKVQFGT